MAGTESVGYFLVLILVGKPIPTLNRFPSRHLGRLVQPRNDSRSRDSAAEGYLWAADNDAFNNFQPKMYTNMLNNLEGTAGCLFVTIPDVVGDAAATTEMFWEWLPELRSRKLPVAYVAQDGLEPFDGPPWDEIDALFIGGSTEYKLGGAARIAIREGLKRGKWIHMGRVNSLKRMTYAYNQGCHSIDGTKVAMFTDTHLPQFLNWMSGLHEPKEEVWGVDLSD